MIYDKPVADLMRHAANQLTPPYKPADFVDWFAEHYPKVNPRTVRAHVIGLTANDPNRHHYHLARRTPLLVRTPHGLRRWDPDHDLGLVQEETDEDVDEDSSEEVEAPTEADTEFALESQLEEFLASNWGAINWGRPLEIWQGPNDQRGHQMDTPVGRLDFLCVDKSSNAFVVVELKRGRPSDKVVGQTARYMGWVKINLASTGQPVEGLIVAHESDDSLAYAVSAVPNLRLMTCEVDFRLRPQDAPVPAPAAN